MNSASYTLPSGIPLACIGIAHIGMFDILNCMSLLESFLSKINRERITNFHSYLKKQRKIAYRSTIQRTIT
jgi:hypothetical protein